MKKLLLAMFIAGLSAGCGIDYDGTTKLIFEGRVTNPDGTPLKGIKVSTFISNNYDSDEIGYDYTDSNGHYLMIFPKAHERVDVEVDINSVIENSSFSRTHVVNISLDQVQDYTIDFGSQTLYETGNSVALHINIPENLSPQKINITTGLVADNIVDYNFTIQPDPDENWVTTDFQVARNQVITLKYLLADGSVHENQVTIGEQDLTYTLQ